MSKQLNLWLDEFVENGADPKNVTDWPANGGSGGSGITENSKIIVDFSQYSTSVNHEGIAWADHILYFYSKNDSGFYSSEAAVSFVVEANEQETQLIAYWGYSDSYTMLSNSVVIYEGDVSQINNTDELELPTVEFTIADDTYNGCICLPYDSEPREGITVVY